MFDFKAAEVCFFQSGFLIYKQMDMGICALLTANDVHLIVVRWRDSRMDFDLC